MSKDTEEGEGDVSIWVRMGVQRRSCHTGLRIWPQLRLKVIRCRWMWKALIVSLSIVGLHFLDCRCLPVHLVLFGPFMWCNTILHHVSSLLLCTHLVSLQNSHLEHGTWYMTPFFLHSDLCLSLTLWTP